MSTDPRAYIQHRLDLVKPEIPWREANVDTMSRTQERLRKRISRVIGLPSEHMPPLDPQIHEKREFPSYIRETIRTVVRDGYEGFGYFLKPTAAKGRLPCIICLPGHGTGVDSLVGIKPDGSMRSWGEWGEYQNDFALQCVAKGYCVFAIELSSFGHRRDGQAMKSGGGSSSCIRDSMAALMLGETMTGWRVHDTQRAIDYVLTRPEVDGSRIATMGISGGGLTSLFTGCLDKRVKVTVVSGYLNTWRASVLSIDHCVDNYAPGLIQVCEMPDMATLIAPRALFAESGAKDNIFPLPAFEGAVNLLTRAYAAFGVPERFGHEVFDADHRFWGRGAFEFLSKNL